MSDSPNNRELLATAYVLGNCSASEIREFETLHASDESFRKLVDDIETTLAPLNKTISDEAAPLNLFEAIMEDIEADVEAKTSTQANDNFNKILTNSRTPSSRRSVSPWWRTGAIAASILCAVSITTHFVSSPETSLIAPIQNNQVELLAFLSSAESEGLVLVVYDPAKQSIIARVQNTATPAEGVWQLWLIREGQPAPLSLGLLNNIDENGRMEIDISAGLVPAEDTLAVSLEPKGGSQISGPSGPVLFVGKVDEI